MVSTLANHLRGGLVDAFLAGERQQQATSTWQLARESRHPGGCLWIFRVFGVRWRSSDRTTVSPFPHSSSFL